MKHRNKYQACIITLSDGSLHTFYGEVAFKPGEKRTIKNIQFMEPAELPEGCAWQSLEKLKT